MKPLPTSASFAIVLSNVCAHVIACVYVYVCMCVCMRANMVAWVATHSWQTLKWSSKMLARNAATSLIKCQVR